MNSFADSCSVMLLFQSRRCSIDASNTPNWMPSIHFPSGHKLIVTPVGEKEREREDLHQNDFKKRWKKSKYFLVCSVVGLDRSNRIVTILAFFSIHFVLNKLFILIFYSLSILCSRLTLMDKKILHWFTFFFHFQSRLFLFRGVRQSASSKLFGQ